MNATSAHGSKKTRGELKTEGRDPREPAKNFYKARLTKGLLSLEAGEGPIVEILNFRTKRVLRRELFDAQDEARLALDAIRSDISNMSIEEFQKKYLRCQE